MDIIYELSQFELQLKEKTQFKLKCPFYNEIKDDDYFFLSADDIASLNYRMTRETQPLFSMGSSSPASWTRSNTTNITLDINFSDSFISKEREFTEALSGRRLSKLLLYFNGTWFYVDVITISHEINYMGYYYNENQNKVNIHGHLLKSSYPYIPREQLRVTF